MLSLIYVGDFILKSVVKDVCGKSLKQINKDMEELGDIGLVTEVSLLKK